MENITENSNWLTFYQFNKMPEFHGRLTPAQFRYAIEKGWIKAKKSCLSDSARWVVRESDLREYFNKLEPQPQPAENAKA
jgi:hypothetical protein